MPRTSTVVAGAFAVLLLTLAGKPSFVREVSRTMGAVADVAEGAGTLAGAMTHAAANATVAVISIAANIATSSLSLARESWLGVDLLNVAANRSHGSIIAKSLDEVRYWAVTNPTFAIMAVEIDMVLQPALKLSSGLPLIGCTDSLADVNAGCWISWKL